METMSRFVSGVCFWANWTLSTLLVVAVVTRAGNRVRITDLVVPSVIKNGSVDSAVLDCVYEVDAANRDGLVVTWYFDGSPLPVYQWIPPNKPQDLGKFKDRLDLTYTVSRDPYEKYRALRILNPTIDLNGEYSCRVSTFDDEDARSATMVVYSPATSFNFSHSKPSSGTVNVTCTAAGIYPRPMLTIYRYPNKRNRHKLENIKWSEERMANGAFEISLSSVVEDKSLKRESMFECELLIPGTGYILKRKMVYFPNAPAPINKERVHDVSGYASESSAAGNAANSLLGNALLVTICLSWLMRKGSLRNG